MSRHSKYSGSTSFDFELERLKSKLTGELFKYDSSIEDNDDYEHHVVMLRITGNSYYVPAYRSGLPEDSYPAEGDTEITSINGPDGKDWSDQLSNSENNDILEMIEAKCADEDHYSHRDDADSNDRYSDNFSIIDDDMCY